MAKTVFLNPGHGGSDPGAVANGFKEKDLNLTIALACRDELERYGINVVMGRDKDANRTSTQIIKACNSSGAELAVDIHNNAGGGDGAEVYYYSGGGTSEALANNILTCIKEVGQNSRGAKTKVSSDGSEYYYFIRETSMPAVIVECAFVDNKTDLEIVCTKAKQLIMGIAIAKGILKTLGVAYNVTDTEPVMDDVDNAKNFETAGVQALLRQAYAQGIVKTFVKPIDNKKGKLTNAAILEAKEFLGLKNPDTTVSLRFISDLEHAVNVKRIAKEDALKAKAEGDINGDGKVNIRDATTLQKKLAGVED